MPIEHAIWKVSKRPVRLNETKLQDEKHLEKMILAKPAILADNWLLIGNQVKTSYGGLVDILALDENQSLIVVELKKHRTPRDVIAQALDYASWAQKLGAHDLNKVYQKFRGDQTESLGEVFQKKYGHEIDEELLNQNHQIIVVAAELDSSTERIVNYLNNLDVPINILFFKVFQDGDAQYLSRTWLLDPIETESKATSTEKGTKQAWNGEYYVSFGEDASKRRGWEDARKYGFVSGGAARWYSRTLNQLSEGDRIWVNVPGYGYVGVGIVQGSAVRADHFRVITDEGEKKLIDLQGNYHYGSEDADNPDTAEYFVPVKWVKSKSLNEAVSQVGFFGNQHTVCKPRTSKWQFTVETLAKEFGVDLNI